MSCPIGEFWEPPEVRGLSWCVIDIDRDNGFRVPQSKDAHMHLVIEGAVRFTSMSGQSLDMAAGDVAIQISGAFHKVHCGRSGPSRILDELASDISSDTPLFTEVGHGHRASRLLSGRLEIGWRGISQLADLPGTLIVRRNDIEIDIGKLFAITTSTGATAVLNRAASLLVVRALHNHRTGTGTGYNEQSPIVRARGLIERHPFAAWSVQALADWVGMCRSSFAARFVAETGKTPIVAVKEERMKHALQFVRNTNLEIGEVSERIGYHSEAAFVRQFAKHFQITPSKLRKQATYRVQ
jgi:AraC-like DNA-binding protein